MITWCWLTEHVCIKLVSCFKRKLCKIETHRFWAWSKRCYFILTWTGEIRKAVKASLLVERQSHPEKKLSGYSWCRTNHRARELHGCPTERQFLRLALGRLLVSQVTLRAKKQLEVCWHLKVLEVEGRFLNSRSYYSSFGHLFNENHFVNFTGATLPKKPKAYTSMRKVVYLNEFVSGYETLFYLKCSAVKKRLNTNVKRENDICLCTHFR